MASTASGDPASQLSETDAAEATSGCQNEAERFQEDYPHLIEEIPDFEGQSYYRPSSIRMGIIADEFNYNEYNCGALDLVYIDPETYEEVVPTLDLLLYVSCWHGIGYFGDVDVLEKHHYQGGKGRERAKHILNYASSQGIPVVFQTTEDPPNFESFVEVAAEADVIFTGCAEMIGEYRRRLGKDDVYAMTYGVNPTYNNPLGFLKRLCGPTADYAQDVFFAGSWYLRYPRRNKDASMIFDGVLGSGDSHELVVADRYYGSTKANYLFPEKYQQYLMPSIDYADLQKVHKLFHFSVNLNTVTDSRTMCARRVYELQALGSLTLSNYSLCVNSLFPGLLTVLDAGEVERILLGYTQDELVALEIEGIRSMYSGNTVYDRLGEIVSSVGIDNPFAERPVYVVVEEKNGESLTFLESQESCNACLVTLDEAAALNDGFAVRLSAPYPSSPWYLVDLVNAFKFTDAEWVAYCDAYGSAYDWVRDSEPEGPAMVDLSRVPPAALLADSLPGGSKGFLICEPKWGRDTSASPKELAVIIPVFNNGRYLWQRAFRSLLRSSAFDRMQVYLIDDGSIDGKSDRAVSWIADTFDNVTAYFFNDGGSGSASRARNKGLELATEPYVAFLDPGDEAIDDGYAKLLDDIEELGVEVAFGSWLRIEAGGDVKNCCFGFEFDQLLDDPAGALLEAGFSELYPQACVIKRSFIAEKGLSFLEGARSEDILFGYELLLNASSAWRRDLSVWADYSEQRWSLANPFDAIYFRRVFLAHQRQVQVFDERGLLEAFRENHLDDCIEEWLMPKLSRVSLEDLPEASAALRDTIGLYEGSCMCAQDSGLDRSNESASALKNHRLGDVEAASEWAFRRLEDAKVNKEVDIANLNIKKNDAIRENKKLAERNKSLSMLSNRLTACIDLKNWGGPGNGLEIIEISDEGASIDAPAWICDDKGEGKVVKSVAGKLELLVHCKGKGELRISLRGQDVKDGSGKRVPFWIDYTTFEVNGASIISGTVSAWHDRPFVYKREVKNGELVALSFSWHSHDVSGLALELGEGDKLRAAFGLSAASC